MPAFLSALFYEQEKAQTNQDKASAGRQGVLSYRDRNGTSVVQATERRHRRLHLVMKAILIDPANRSLETIDILAGTSPEALQQLYRLVGENALDEALIAPGEVILVGDHSALQDPPLPRYFVTGHKWPLYGRGVVVGYHRGGKERETRLSVEELSEMIEFE